MLLHNGNKIASVPIGHSVVLKEHYLYLLSIKMVLDELRYQNHNWIICVDLKMVDFLLGQQGGYTKYSCFLCLWDSRNDGQHWQRKHWLARDELVVGEKT